jgi:hypothetical protein
MIDRSIERRLNMKTCGVLLDKLAIMHHEIVLYHIPYYWHEVSVILGIAGTSSSGVSQPSVRHRVGI